MTISNIQAVLFDLDGTLVNSESLSERALAELLPTWGVDTTGLDFVQFHGVTWKRIEARLIELFPHLRDRDVADTVADRFQELFKTAPPTLIEGAREAVVAASQQFPGAVTIVTGSDRRAVEHFLDRTSLHEHCSGYTSSEMYGSSKPDPECYLMAAERLRVSPDRCLVFEDSEPGLRAASSAGMPRVAITDGHPARQALAAQLADMAIADYRELPDGFFSSVAQRD
jgi:HAD superfamily hydrolase (TIGR01509 family)